MKPFSFLSCLAVLALVPAVPNLYAYNYGCANEGQDPPECPAIGANPINASRGNLYREVTDLEIAGAASIRFTRYITAAGTR